MKTFNQAKKEVLELAFKEGACSNIYERAKSLKSRKALLKIIKSEFYWLYFNKIITKDLLCMYYSEKELENEGIYVCSNKLIKINKDSNLIILGSQNTIETWDSSQNTIETWDSSQNTIETLGSSQNTIKTLDSSQNTIKTWDSSQNTKTIKDNSVLIDLLKKEIYFVKGNYKVIRK